MVVRVTAVDNYLSDPVIQWADQRLEDRYNKCHSPDSGQFCSGSGGGAEFSGTVGSVGPIAPGLKESLDDRAVTSIDRARNAIGAKYPQAKVMTINETETLGHNSVAQTESTEIHSASGRMTVEPAIISFDSSAADYDATTKKYADSIEAGYHPKAGPNNDVYEAITTHELGHVVDFTGEREAHFSVPATLHDMWWNDRGSTGDYADWIRHNISGYAVDDLGNLNVGEAIAEAFQDVEMNGPAASGASQAVHSKIVAAYNNAVMRNAV